MQIYISTITFLVLTTSILSNERNLLKQSYISRNKCEFQTHTSRQRLMFSRHFTINNVYIDDEFGLFYACVTKPQYKLSLQSVLRVRSSGISNFKVVCQFYFVSLKEIIRILHGCSLVAAQTMQKSADHVTYDERVDVCNRSALH